MSITAINPAAIPQVHGDMVALSQEAQRIQRVANTLIQRGQDLHAAWQGLANCFHTPETTTLLLAMAPVRDLAGKVGHTQHQIGLALDRYASEMQGIQQRLRNLKREAEALRTDIDAFTAGQEEHRKRDEAETTAGDLFGINDAEDWSEDSALSARHDDLLRRINQAVADRQACEIECTNAIAAAHGGRRYHVGNGDGQHQPGEYGASAEHYNTLAGEGGTAWGQSTEADDVDVAGWFKDNAKEIGHTTLDVVGLIPVVGEAADLANAAWYAADGDYTNAALSGAAAIPFAGWAATGGKFGVKGVRMVKSADSAKAWAKNKPPMVPRNAEKGEFKPNNKFTHGEKYKWRDPETGETVQYHAHGRDPNVAPQNNAGSGPVYRMKVGEKPNIRYLDAEGNEYPLKEIKKNDSAANATHIPYPKDYPPPDQSHVRFNANPAGFAGPNGEEQ